MDSKQTAGGIGLPSLLGITFLVLKLTGVIDWPWVWVLSPFWIPVAFVFLIIILSVLIFS
jgi:hypothetical protein